MKRRQLLAVVATGVAGATAGCGYAYGGGDVRDEQSVMSGVTGLRRHVAYATTTEHIVVAKSYRRLPTDSVETVVSLADRDGAERWMYTHDSDFETVATGDATRAYLLDEGSSIVAIDAAESTENQPGDVSETDRAWRVYVSDIRPMLAGNVRGAYVPRERSLVALQNGQRVWVYTFDDRVETVVATKNGPIVTTSGAVIAIDNDGTQRWQYETETSPIVAQRESRVYVRDGRDLVSIADDTGTQRWRVSVGLGTAPPHPTGELLAVTSAGQVSVLDVADGSIRWESPRAPDSIAVPDTDQWYGVHDDCTVVAVGEDGRRWSRQIETSDCTVIDGWIEDETVAFLLASDTIVRLQRRDQEPGILW